MMIQLGRRFRLKLSSIGFNSISRENMSSNIKRVDISDPKDHNSEHVGMFYTIPPNVQKELFGLGGLPKSFVTNTNTFAETCLMVRTPALEVISLLKKTNFKNPVIRYVLYGKPGCGKSLSLSHILHFAFLQDFYILHIPWVWNWFSYKRNQVVLSTSHPGHVDLPVIAANWLRHFQSQNSKLLSKKLQIHKDYVWNPRETTPAGSPISDLVSHGINRIKYACDCIDAIINEIKASAKEDKCKAIIAVDGFNAFFGNDTNLKTDDHVKITPKQVTLSQSFLEATKNDWCNGAVVLTVDQMSARYETLNNHLPLYLLGKEGFEHIDPFICISVDEFTDFELNNMLDYYEDRQWIQRTGGRDELSFISCNNPYQLMQLCARL